MKYKINDKIQLVNLTYDDWQKIHPFYSSDDYGDLFNSHHRKCGAVKGKVISVDTDEIRFPIKVSITGPKGRREFLVTPNEVKLINQKQKLYRK